jgi:antitoxin component YwqK of YwqJK toxin-antitoxin module
MRYPNRMKDKFFTNGQRVTSQKGDVLTYYYKSGPIKAKGKSIANVMQGKWIFNREDSQLCQVGHFKDGLKHGEWIRYDEHGEVEYHERFVLGKIVKRK